MVKIHLSKQDILAQKLSFVLISLRKHMMWVLIRSAAAEVPHQGAFNE